MNIAGARALSSDDNDEDIMLYIITMLYSNANTYYTYSKERISLLQIHLPFALDYYYSICYIVLLLSSLVLPLLLL